MSARFSPVVEATLRAAGWTPGRRLSDAALAEMFLGFEAGQDRFGTRLTQSYLAKPVLAEFGGLVIAPEDPELDLNPRPFALDPALAAHSVETLLDAGRAMGSTLYPLGVEGLDEALLVITDMGKVLAIDPVDEWFLGDSIDEALDLLITGRRPRPVARSDVRRPDWVPPEPDDEEEEIEFAAKAPLYAAFYLPHTPFNLHDVWLPAMLTRIGVPLRRGPFENGEFQISDWGGVYCEVHVQDLPGHTVLLLVFGQNDVIGQLQNSGSDELPPPDVMPLARAFRNACAALTPELSVAFLQLTRQYGIRPFLAERDMDALTFDVASLLRDNFSMLYLTDQALHDLDGALDAALTSSPRGRVPIDGGRIVLGGPAAGFWW